MLAAFTDLLDLLLESGSPINLQQHGSSREHPGFCNLNAGDGAPETKGMHKSKRIPLLQDLGLFCRGCEAATCLASLNVFQAGNA